MTSNAWEDLGFAIRKARLDLCWTLEQLAEEALNNGARKGYVGEVEKGKRNLSPETIDKFDQALDLPKDVVKAAHLAPPPGHKQATDKKGSSPSPRKPLAEVDNDAEYLLSRAARDDTSPRVAEALLTTLAYEFAKEQYRDLHTAYTALRQALEAAEKIRKRGEMPPDNSGNQLNVVMAEVAKLNDQGDTEDADALLDAEEIRMREAQKEERERMEQQAQAMLTLRLDQDRLRNRPDMAAARINRNLREFPQGKLFTALDNKACELTEQGHKVGDVFNLEVALALAQKNCARLKPKKPQAAKAFVTLGWAHFRVAIRSHEDSHLHKARDAFIKASKICRRANDLLGWSSCLNGLGSALDELGQRQQNATLLEQAVSAHRTSVKTGQKYGSTTMSNRFNNLGTALLGLGELTKEADTLKAAEEALLTSLEYKNKDNERERRPLEWALTQNNLAVAQRRLGAVTSDQAKLREARKGYAACEDLAFENKAEFQWAILQWNIADLALCCYRFDPDPALLAEAREYVGQAHVYFAAGSDYQTGRCATLLAKIEAAEAELPLKS